MKMSKFFAWALCLVLLLAANALAEEVIDAGKNVRLTLAFEDEGVGLPGAKFSLHRIANVDAAGKPKAIAPFNKYNVNIGVQGESALAGVASTLEGYVLRDGIAPAISGSTDQNGALSFSGSKVKQGVYLVLGEKYSANGVDYTIQPSVVQLPSWDAINKRWNYDVVIKAKYESASTSTEDQTISRKVLKVWDKAGGNVALPKEVVVQLLRDGEVYDTVTLNAGKNWRHSWEALDARYRWTVVEKEMENYSVLVTREGITFVVTNTYEPDEDQPQPTPTPKPTNPPKKPGKPKLPQTGQLWWPVAMLVSAGLLLIVIGVARRRGN